MIRRVLVANRGEIARRVFRTCRELGIETVAVFSDADAEAPFVREADAAVRLPGNAPADTYLRGDLVVAAARQAGADAIHPGYGFLSERADFAALVEESGIRWIGPPAEAIASMGSKVDAKKLMADAGVPVLEQLDPSAVTRADVPVLVKASAGGGGRGMRVVRDLADLPTALAEARAEAESAFGDPTVFCERYLETGRHIEMQVLSDRHGGVWVFTERDCSVQRRHQKVVEESPSPVVGDDLRRRLAASAQRATETIGYVGAGTVEFLVTASDEYFFLEMNTRLQVEHPVTELVHGVDLVERQLVVAEGARLEGEPPPPSGHAIEVRLYAEDPAADWLPQSGTLHRFAIDGPVRVDSGVEAGSEVGVHYDAMLAKVVAQAPTRAAAARTLAGTLVRADMQGVLTNRDLLVRILRDREFLAGRADTSYLGGARLTELARPLADPADRPIAALAAALADAERRRRDSGLLPGVPAAWRNVSSQQQTRRFLIGGTEVVASYSCVRDRLVAEGVDVVSVEPDLVVLDVAGVRRRLPISRQADGVWVGVGADQVRLRPVPRFADPAAQVAAGSMLAAMPGTVVDVRVAEGEPVARGDVLIVVEAMKMQHTVHAPDDGVVTVLAVAAGEQVAAGAVIAVVTPADPGGQS
ncbi:MAG: ATP-grasp domain-containing protein [Propionibacteriales bacterium]|nr:ATP-grasp domain-containing protein [Propionibacteriales bacterium]